MTPPPRELEALIGAARDLPGPPPDAAARLIERLDAAHAAGAAAAGTGGKAAAMAASKTALVLGGAALVLIGAVAGGAVVLATRSPLPAPAPIQILIAPPRPPQPASPEPASAELEPPHVQPAPAPPLPLRAAPRPPPSQHSTLEEERKLLEGARAAAVAGAWSEALSAVDAHATRFPNGALAEEREAIAIQALGATDRAAAVSRATNFRRRWPTSIFEPLIEKILPRDGSAGSPQ